MKFALRILRLYRAMPKVEEARVIGRQLLRSGTPVGANYRAACRSRSKAEFISKLGVVVEELDETVFWLELLMNDGLISGKRLGALVQESNELLAIFGASQLTAKGLRQ